MIARLLLLLFYPILSFALVLNNPYSTQNKNQKVYYTSFSEQPKTLDPAKSYASNEYQFITQIYEPIIEYDYFKRPFVLIPLTAASLPEVQFLDAAMQPIARGKEEEAAYTMYTIRLKPHIYYQPHPAFAKNRNGGYCYHHLSKHYLDEHNINHLEDFKQVGTRELLAEDYIYQIKRLASPKVNSPIYGLLSNIIVGFHEYGASLPKQGDYDLRQYPLKGVQAIDRYSYRIIVKGQYAQFIYWLAMPFFAPIPWEADVFYHQPNMDKNNLNFSWYPIGTGPFMLSENNPNRRMILARNPNYHMDRFPTASSKADIEKGFLAYQGQRLPLLDKAIFTLEKEVIPRWNKFLQGYYDISGLTSDSFDQAVHVAPNSHITLTKTMQQAHIALDEVTDLSIFYLGVNMLDPVIGGNSEQSRKLRQAIAIAIDYEEQIAIFLNGRGQVAQSPIPPGLFGFKAAETSYNPYVYTLKNQRIKRRSLKEAKQLMREAGYPDGIDPKTGQPLLLHYNVPSSGGPDDKEQLSWMIKQFAKLGIALNIQATQFNQFQEKIRNGNAQLFSWGWNADYPDPENFLSLLYGKNGKVQYGGENVTNYYNARFDALYDLMKNRPNDAKRQQLIDEMVDIWRHDAPWIGAVVTQSIILSQQWVSPIKNNTISWGTLKFVDIDVKLRQTLQATWNQAILWPLWFMLFACCIFILPMVYVYYKKQHAHVRRIP